MSVKITELLSSERIDLIARETGFMPRQRNVHRFDFLKSMLFSNATNAMMSLEDIAVHLAKTDGVSISKQAVDKKFNESSILFFKKLIEYALKSVNINTFSFTAMTKFKEVRIKDSTCFQLPSKLASYFPGSGGASSSASIRIQFEYDLKSGKVIDLSLNAFNVQDMTDAENTLHMIESDVLIIRDLGYVSMTAIKGIKSRKAYFISRMPTRADAYELKEGIFVKLDFKKICQQMKKNNLARIEKDVFITTEHEPVRMVIELMPDKIVQGRLEKANREAKKKGRQLGDDYKSRAALNIFITNVLAEDMTAEEIHVAYTFRWQIELIFKTWKSNAKIHLVKPMKYARLVTLLYAKLLLILLNWSIYWAVNHLSVNTLGKIISPFKFFKSVYIDVSTLREKISMGQDALDKYINNLTVISFKHYQLDKKKDKSTLYYLFSL